MKALATGIGEQRKRREQPRQGPGARIWALVALVTLAGVALTALGGWTWRGEHLAVLLGLAVLAMAAERFDFSVYGDSRVSVSFVPMFSAVILAGLPGLAVVVPAAVLASEVGARRPLHKALFNFGALMVAGAGAGLVFALSGYSGRPEAWPEALGPALAAAALYFAVNSSLVAAAVGLSTRRSLWSVWDEKFRWLWPHYLVLGLMGLAMATAYKLLGLWGLTVFLAPTAMMLYSFKQYLDRTSRSVLELQQAHRELQTAHQELSQAMESQRRAYHGTLRALIAALDHRDSETRGHSERVADLALAIAEEMGFVHDSREWQELQWGALLHDVGKIGVPDDILRNSGRLSAAEWEAMKSHPARGYEILSDVDFLGGAAKIVCAHHERYDGSGYPRGLAGQEIPLGARIFSVADAFDAMTSDRPYRQALPPEEALAEVLRNSGSQFDPAAVEAFLKIYLHRFAPSRRGKAGSATALSPSLRQAIWEALGGPEE